MAVMGAGMDKWIRVGQAEIELKTRAGRLLGLGRIRIAGRLVRGGELPIRPFTQTLDGIDYDRYEIIGIHATPRRAVIKTRAIGVAGAAQVALDHSLDPLWSTRPWDGRPVAEDRMDWILEAGERTFGDQAYAGFSYQFRFQSPRRSVYYLLDRATWELDGRAEGITLLRQQMGTEPRVTLRGGTNYNTSARIPYPLNPAMTHDVPRWASEQGFDYQCRDGAALIGVFDNCGLIRTIVTRDAGEPAIRHFDKHIFDQTRRGETVRKFIGLCTDVGDETAHLNAWTRVYDADMDNVLGEFAMHRTPSRTTLAQNYWHHFDADTYRRDLLPAAAALGFQQVFIDPLWENDMTRTREGKLPRWLQGNMCCPHEYEVARLLGGAKGYQRLTRDAARDGVDVISWIGSHQSMVSPYLWEHTGEVLKLADGRHFYGSGYDVIRGMDLTSAFGPMFRQAITRGAKATGVRGFLYDSFYNFGWMPVSFNTPDPGAPGDVHRGKLSVHTQWRAAATMMAAWQKAGLHMLIESLGPWGQPQHGVHGNYSAPGCEPLAYRCAVASGQTVIPVSGTSVRMRDEEKLTTYFRLLANMAPPSMPLWIRRKGEKPVRIDRSAGAALRIANQAYRRVLPLMHTRTLLPDGLGVSWAPERGKRGVLFALRSGVLAARKGARYEDLTADAAGTCGPGGLPVEAGHVYVLSQTK
jgi:hypothetical protein